MQPFGPNGRVRLGFAIDAALAPSSILTDVFDEVRALGAHLITSHETRIRMLDSKHPARNLTISFSCPEATVPRLICVDVPSAVKVLSDNNLLGPDVLLSHANHTDSNERKCILVAGAHISSTPVTEMQMGHGDPIALQPDIFGSSSLGIDCHSICSSFMPTQMLTLLQSSRARRYTDLMEKNQWDASIGPTVEDVFNLGTILGAKSIGLEDEIGSLQVGKKADLVIFDAKTPAMLSVSKRDPIAGIVLHSSVRDIRTVIVDGIIRKENSSLSSILAPSNLCVKGGVSQQGERLTWDDVAAEVEKSREGIQRKVDITVDEDKARDGLIWSFLEGVGNNG